MCVGVGLVVVLLIGVVRVHVECLRGVELGGRLWMRLRICVWVVRDVVIDLPGVFYDGVRMRVTVGIGEGEGVE